MINRFAQVDLQESERALWASAPQPRQDLPQPALRSLAPSRLPASVCC
jgi:hypothetical protein